MSFGKGDSSRGCIVGQFDIWVKEVCSVFHLRGCYGHGTVMKQDVELLRQYALHGVESAFEELVQRHLPFVYSTALRQLRGDETLAKDVAQSVFIDLARKARSVADRDLLPGWLFTSTRLAVSKTVRKEHRRRRREQLATALHEDCGLLPEGGRGELRVILDEAMGELGEVERNALLLRFFQEKDLKEIGGALGLSEDAARMRISRALEKLQVLLKRRGVTVTATALAVALSAEAISAAPSALACAVGQMALAAAKTTGPALSVFKMKLGAAGLALLVGLGTPWAIYRREQSQLQEEHASLRRTEYKLSQLKADNQRLAGLVAEFRHRGSVANVQENELLRLRGEVGRLRLENGQVQNLLAQNEAFRRAFGQPPADMSGNDSQQAQLRPLIWASGAFRMYATEHQGTYPTSFVQLSPYLLAGTNEDVIQTWNEGLEIVPGKATTNSPPDTPIVRMKAKDGFGQRWSVYADGSIQFKADEQ